MRPKKVTSEDLLQNLLENLTAAEDASVSGAVADEYMRIGLSPDTPPALKREIGRVIARDPQRDTDLIR